MKSKKFNKLKHLKSPYLVKFSKDVESAIEYAKTELSKIPQAKENIEKYLESKIEMPLWVVEAVCNINLKNNLVPVKYQYLWYCLHGTVLTRKQPSGRIFNTKVNFTTVYLSIDDKIKQHLMDVSKITNISLSRLPRLWSHKPSNYISQGRIPLIAILKISQILQLDPWKILKGRTLYGKTNFSGKITVPENYEDIELLVLLTWLNTEGHIDLGSTHIEINQQENNESLLELKKLFIKKFGLNESSLIFAKGSRGEDRLLISSSPLKQFLVMRYNQSPGYKTGSIEGLSMKNLSEEDYRKLMAAFIQTEGCLSYGYTRNKKKRMPRFEFIVKDKNLSLDCLKVLRYLEFEPKYYDKKGVYKVGLYESKKVISLIEKTKSYLYSNKKLVYLKKVCSDGIGL